MGFRRPLAGLAAMAGTAALLVAMLAPSPARAQRQHLSADEAARHRAADYLAQGPSPWQPQEVDPSRWRADFVVALDGSGTHRSLQAAVDAVPAAGTPGADRRWHIRVEPGVYREALCVQGKPPLTIWGAGSQAARVRLVDGRHNGLAKPVGVDSAQRCHPQRDAATHGTSGSATAIIDSPDVLLARLTVANDATEQARVTEGAQAVALLTRADRIQLEDVVLVSHQDTFYVRRPRPDQPARVVVRGSVIAGDVDFVFGNATLVIDDSTLVSRGGRGARGARGGYVLAPSTPAAARLGFLVQRSRFVAEPGVAPGSVALGRAWDEGVAPGAWRAGASPDGQVVVRDSALGPHIGPWAPSTSRRAFEPGRMAEFGNRVLEADPAREVPGPDDGWAAAEGGLRGGADAAPADVHRVRTRAQLVAALRPHPRPRIVQVEGTVDLSVDDAGRPLGAEQFRDPAFDWAAFAAAYDPATWGRRPPEGPLEEARRRSAQAHAAHVVLRVPSRTTLIGLGPDAQIVRGGLMLDGVDDVIVRNLRLRDAHDPFPAWDPRDNGHGEWNSELDNLTLRRSTRVWIDHCSFDDGEPSPEPARVLLGRPMVHHDGLLDITRGSDRVTVSWSHFRHHDKTMLIGGSDRHAEDEGRLRVTLHHNRWEQTRERSPRVRYGRVHVVNNLYEVTDEAGFGYSIGVGHRSAIVSSHNVWQAPSSMPPQRLVRALGGDALRDQGSWLNGQPVDLVQLLRASLPGRDLADPGWQPVAAGQPDAAHEVAARVRAGAGAGRLWTPAPSTAGQP